MQQYLQLLQQLGSFVPAVLVLLGSVVALATALSGVLNLIVTTFKLEGGKLDHLANLIEAIGVDVGKAIDFIRSLAAKFGIGTSSLPSSQRPTPPAGIGKVAILFVAISVALLASSPARAAITLGDGDLVLSYGPSLPVVQIDLKDHAQTSVAQGAGLMASLELPKLSFAMLGKSWSLVSLDALAYGSLVNGAAGAQFGQLLVGGMVAFLNSILGVGWAHSLFSPGGDGVLLVALSFNVELAPSSPPVGTTSGALGLPRGNSIQFGSF
jgi:hypothetical protein